MIFHHHRVVVARRCFSTSPPSSSSASKRIAVVGGGISGLSAAFHLSRRFPDASLTLFEASDRVGGWVRSERVQVQNDRGQTASMLLEAGPRTVRPSAMSILELINLLGLREEVIAVPDKAEAAVNRFLYFPELGRLEALPTSVWKAWKSPLRSVLLPAFYKEPFKSANRPAGIKDESVDSFLSRRFSPALAAKFGSAILHGIYGADSRNVSVNAAFPMAWGMEDAGDGSVFWGAHRYKQPFKDTQFDLGPLVLLLKDTSVFSLKNGLSSLTDAMRSYLDKQATVSVRTNAPVRAIEGTKLHLDAGEEYDATHIVSTVSLPVLDKILAPVSIPHLTTNPSSSVTLMNFVFPVPPSSIHPAGFGYLIPRPEAGYDASNPGVLGATFDSCSLSKQDTPGAINNFTKLTVMAGGPHPNVADVPEVLRHLQQQLGLKELPQPVLTRVHEHKNCIPTPLPGHLQRLEEMYAAIKEKWEGKLEVIGASVVGVSVGDCADAGRDAGKDW